jgi:hypothetical protein
VKKKASAFSFELASFSFHICRSAAEMLAVSQSAKIASDAGRPVAIKIFFHYYPCHD